MMPASGSIGDTPFEYITPFPGFGIGKYLDGFPAIVSVAFKYRKLRPILTGTAGNNN